MAEQFITSDITGDGKWDLDLTDPGSFGSIGGALFTDSVKLGAGTGNYNTFLAVQDNNDAGSAQAAFNSDTSSSSNPEMKSQSHTVLLGNIPITTDAQGNQYYEFRIDINEANSDPDAQISLDKFQIYLGSSDTVTTLTQLQALGSPIYDMDAFGRDVSVLLSDAGSTGSGTDDYAILVPVSYFGTANPGSTWLYLYVEMGAADTVPPDTWGATATFEEFNTQIAGSISGTKFNDANANGQRDAGEGGIDGVTIFIDSDQDGVLDVGERSTVTSDGGHYTFYSVATGTYQIRELLPPNSVRTTGDYETVTVSGIGNFVVDPIGNFNPNPHLTLDKSIFAVSGGVELNGGNTGTTADDAVNSAGDVITYKIAVLNDGNVALTSLNVADLLEGADFPEGTAVQTGGTAGDNIMQVGETWTYTFSYTVTQADIDNNGGAFTPPSGAITNSASSTALYNSTTVTSNTDTVSTPIVRNPAIDVTKSVVSVTGGDTNGTPLDLTDDKANTAGDTINYRITIANTGNVSLTGVTVTDAVENYGATNAAYVSGDTGNDGVLGVGETWVYSASYGVTQTDLDNQGGGDGKIDNLATGDTAQTAPDTATASSLLVYNPAIDVTKSVVSVTGGDTNGTPLDLTDDKANTAGDTINYRITIANTGNVSLTGVTVTDAVENYGATNAAYVSGDTGNDGVLGVGETWVYSASYGVTQTDLDNRGGGDGKIDNLATGDTAQTAPDTATASSLLVYNPAIDVTKSVVSVTGGDTNGTPLDLTDDKANTAGDTINYRITIANTGNVSLTGVTVTDAVENYGATNAAYVSGDTGNDGVLGVGETWVYSASYGVTQTDLDNRGGGDGKIDNLATGDTAQTAPDTATASSLLVYNPAFSLEKQILSVAGGYDNGTALDPEDDIANSAGDVITYRLTITNTGNVTLALSSIVDTLEGAGYAIGTRSGDSVDPDNLNVGESWTYTFTYTLTAADLNDANTTFDDVINNAASATFLAGSTPITHSDSVYTNIANVDVTKLVSKTGTTYTDANSSNPYDIGYENVTTGGELFFRVTAQNTGAVELTNVSLKDVNGTNGGNVENYLVQNSALTAYATSHVTNLVTYNGQQYVSGDADYDFNLDVGETWTIDYKEAIDKGAHVNTVSITDTQGALDSDAAYYYGVQPGPGVRTPGFWSNLGSQFWDGVTDNETKSGPTFAQGELLYAVDSDGPADGNDLDAIVVSGGVLQNKTTTAGLLVGDWDRDGVTDADEDTLFISWNDARNLINASQKTQAGDGVQMLGRDVVATWLNYLAGNPVGDTDDVNSPAHFLQDAVDWMQIFAGSANGGTDEQFDRYAANHAPVKTSSAAWNLPQVGDSHTAALMHGELDYYNNTGDTYNPANPAQTYQYAMSADTDAALINANQGTV